MCLFRTTFAKPLLRNCLRFTTVPAKRMSPGYPETFAHGWRLTIYMHLNIYNIQHPIKNCKRNFIHKIRDYTHKLNIYA